MLQPTDPFSRIKKTREQAQNFFGLSFHSGARLAKTLSVLSPRVVKLLLSGRAPKPQEVREVFEQLGVTYIKLGQFIASSPSIFPVEYVEEFQSCLDRTPTIPFSKVKKIIEAELGASLNDLFSWVDREALASASIAQVHAARLHSGEEVVIKVQKSGVDKIIVTDLNFVFVVSRLIELLAPGLSKEALTGFISEIYKYMIDECDFIKEADNLRVFQEFLDDSSNDKVIVPKHYASLSSKRVLTMERFRGVNISEFDKLNEYTDSPSDVLICAMNTWFESLTNCKFFHADLHSGNLMLLEDGRIGFIDFGMIGRIEKDKWAALFGLFNGLMNVDAESIADAMLTVGMTDAKVSKADLLVDVERFIVTIKGGDSEFGSEFGYELGSGNNNGIETNIEHLLMDIGQLARKHGLRFPHAFTLVVKQFLYFDRYISVLEPGMDMFLDERITMLKQDMT